MKNSFNDLLQAIKVCDRACDWVGNRTELQAWNNCPRGDWMLHWAKVRQTDIHQWALAKALCARLVYDFMSEPARQAVEATISFGKGEISKEQLLPYYNMALSSAAMAEARSTISMANYAAAYACNLENYYNSPAYSAFKVLDRKERVLEWCADICRSTITLDTSKPIKVESIWLL